MIIIIVIIISRIRRVSFSFGSSCELEKAGPKGEERGSLERHVGICLQ